MAAGPGSAGVDAVLEEVLRKRQAQQRPDTQVRWIKDLIEILDTADSPEELLQRAIETLRSTLPKSGALSSPVSISFFPPGVA